jgi:VWFA-related protein
MPRRRALVVLTDGEDTVSLTTFDSLLERTRQAGVAIYVITLGARLRPASCGDAERRFEMTTLARETGARAFQLDRLTDLSAMYRVIASELQHQYWMAYVPRAPRRAGAFTRVQVLVDQPETRVRTRSGYIAARTGG